MERFLVHGRVEKLMWMVRGVIILILIASMIIGV